MKKVLLFVTLCIFALGTKAQELSFEETVKYINDKIKCCSMYNSDTISVSRKGIINRGKISLLDLMSSTGFKYVDPIFEVLSESNGIVLYQCYGISTKTFGVELLKSSRKPILVQ